MSNITIERKIILTLGAIVLIVPLTAILGEFAFCKYICWLVPFMIIGSKIRDYFRFNGLRLKSETIQCNSCKVCTTKCPMNLDVMENVRSGRIQDIECTLCGSCIDHCKQKAIKFTFKK